MGDDLLQDRPAAFAVSTAVSISAWVDWGTLVTTWRHQSRIALVFHSTYNEPGWLLIL